MPLERFTDHAVHVGLGRGQAGLQPGQPAALQAQRLGMHQRPAGSRFHRWT